MNISKLICALALIVALSYNALAACPTCIADTDNKLFGPLDASSGQVINLVGPSYVDWGNPDAVTRSYTYLWMVYNMTTAGECPVYAVYKNGADVATNTKDISFDAPPVTQTATYLVRLFVYDNAYPTLCKDMGCGIITVQPQCCVISGGVFCWNSTNIGNRDQTSWPANTTIPNQYDYCNPTHMNGIIVDWYLDTTWVDEGHPGYFGLAWNTATFGSHTVTSKIYRDVPPANVAGTEHDAGDEFIKQCSATVVKVKKPVALITGSVSG